PLNDASPARGCPSACVGKSQHVDASRSVRPSMAHAPGGTEERVCTEARAIASPSPAWGINADGRGGWVKVKICLGLGESRGDAGGPSGSPVDDDVSGTHRTESAGGLERGSVSSERRHFDLISEERVHER